MDYSSTIIWLDHFFNGDPANIKAFADACLECGYQVVIYGNARYGLA
jgi:hypothetical protein